MQARSAVGWRRYAGNTGWRTGPPSDSSSGLRAARAKLNRMAARTTRLPKQKVRPLAQMRVV